MGPTSKLEGALLRNLHAHNCRGVILSWASLNQKGQGHINNHAFSHVAKMMTSLGYFVNNSLTSRLRKGVPAAGLPTHKYVASHVAAFERFERISPCPTVCDNDA